MLASSGSGLEDGTRGAVVLWFFFPSSFLCVSGLSFCEVAGKGRGSGKLLGAGVRFEVYETASLLSL